MKKSTLFLLAVLTITACGDDDDPIYQDGGHDSSSDATTNTDVPIDNLPSLFTNALCAEVNKCSPLVSDVMFQGMCESAFKSNLENGDFRLWKEAIEAGTLKYDGKKVNACLDAIKNYGCKAVSLNGVPDECDAVFTGTLASGESCIVEVECEGDSSCRNTTNSDNFCTQVCVPRVDSGAACDVADCKENLRCVNNVCQAPIADGEACNEDDDNPCAEGSICFFSKCIKADSLPANAEGESCNIFSEGTDREVCAVGLSCLLTVENMIQVQTCGKRAASGEACNFGFPAACPTNEYCKIDMTGNGICTASPTNGEACSNHPFRKCANDHICAADVCVVQKNFGEACDNDGDCKSGECVADKCAAHPECS